MKRILIVTVFTLILSSICFWIVKLWGQSQTYPDYNHPLFTNQTTPITFIKPSYESLKSDLQGEDNLYLNVSSTLDQKVVLPIRAWALNEKPLRNQNYGDVKNDVILLTDYKDKLKSRKIIFNLIENAQAGHGIFFYAITEMGFQSGDNFIVTSPYEALIKALKEMQPALVYGTTTPEILKILAMNSMFLPEAVNIRADVIIHPLKIRNQTFFTPELLKEFARRHKRIIVGPIAESEKEKAVSLNPYGLIIQK